MQELSGFFGWWLYASALANLGRLMFGPHVGRSETRLPISGPLESVHGDAHRGWQGDHGIDHREKTILEKQALVTALVGSRVKHFRAPHECSTLRTIKEPAFPVQTRSMCCDLVRPTVKPHRVFSPSIQVAARRL